jgi:poly-gamma-glutamate synthesis protein (capsule biosynthesis protein)
MKKLFGIVSVLTFLLISTLLVAPVLGPGSSRTLSANDPPLPGPETASTSDAVASTGALWIGPSVPPALRLQAESWGVPLTADSAAAALRLDAGPERAPGAVWVYALVAPFPTISDGVTLQELMANWKGAASGSFAGKPLLMDASTLATFSARWGSPAPGSVRSLPADQLLEAAWAERPSWAIVPFESLDPRWKVLEVDGQSPIHKDFQAYRYFLQTSFDYPLAVTFELSCSRPCPFPVLPVLPSTNRDPSKMTTLIMTGVTALVRATAYTMDTKGITYPGRDIRDWLVHADITHISNEIPFFDQCPDPDPDEAKLIFCSNPHYIQLLNYVGADVVELTGNHFADYSPLAMLQTLQIYRENDIAHYGGGADLEEARKPLLLESNGNKIAFIGCNSVDIGRPATASANRAGAAPCDYDYMTREIRRLRGQGYVVITTFQYYETYVPKPYDAQVRDFRLMADAGAAIVQGSQAHYPQSMEFYHGAFIHYGLGNLFFDQMEPGTRHEFLDRYVVYDGRLISTELLTAVLEDYSQPHPMSPEERAAFLAQYFSESGW